MVKDQATMRLFEVDEPTLEVGDKSCQMVQHEGSHPHNEAETFFIDSRKTDTVVVFPPSSYPVALACCRTPPVDMIQNDSG